MQQLINIASSAKNKAELALRDSCFRAGLNCRDTEICIDYFINRLSHKEMAVKYNITIESSGNKKHKLKQKIK